MADEMKQAYRKKIEYIKFRSTKQCKQPANIKLKVNTIFSLELFSYKISLKALISLKNILQSDRLIARSIASIAKPE